MPCHLHVQELREPDVELLARLFVMVAAKMVANSETMKQRMEKTEEAMFSFVILPGY